MEGAHNEFVFNGSLTSETMVAALFNATTEIIINGFECGLSFNETVNDTDNDGPFEVDDGGGYHHDYGTSPLVATINLYVKLVVDVVGLLGNVVVILMVTFCNDLHSAANYHFLNMAVADFILLLENLFSRISNIIDFDVFSAWECVPVYLHTVVVQTSSLTLAGLSIDRFKLIVRPLKNLRDRSTTKVFISLFAVWFVSFALHIPIQLFSTQTGSYCKVILPWVHGKLVFGIYSNIVLFYMPVAIVLYCNLNIIAKIRRKKPGVSYLHRAPKPNLSLEVSEDDVSAADSPSAPVPIKPFPPTITGPSTDAKRSNRRTRSTRIVVTVVIAYIAFNLPFYAFYTVSLIPGAVPWKVYYDGHTYLALLLLLNSAINPFIYSFMGSKYRFHIQQMLRCLCCAEKLPASPSQNPSKRPTESDRIDTPSNARE